jgi:hypothetical protein
MYVLQFAMIPYSIVIGSLNIQPNHSELVLAKIFPRLSPAVSLLLWLCIDVPLLYNANQMALDLERDPVLCYDETVSRTDSGCTSATLTWLIYSSQLLNFLTLNCIFCSFHEQTLLLRSNKYSLLVALALNIGFVTFCSFGWSELLLKLLDLSQISVWTSVTLLLIQGVSGFCHFVLQKYIRFLVIAIISKLMYCRRKKFNKIHSV